MKLSIAGSEKQEKHGPVTSLRLRKDGADIDVVAINEAGEEQSIVSFLGNIGKLYLYVFEGDFGFEQNKVGKILIVR